MKKPDLKVATNEELILYIEWAAPILEASGDLKTAIAGTVGAIAKELEKVNAGDMSDLPILKGDDKLFEKINLIIKSKSDWITSATIVETEETKTTTKKKITKMQDIVLKGK